MTPQDEGRLLATVEQLAVAVPQLTEAVRKLESQQTFWKGAAAGISIMSAGIGALVATGIQWFHK